VNFDALITFDGVRRSSPKKKIEADASAEDGAFISLIGMDQIYSPSHPWYKFAPTVSTSDDSADADRKTSDVALSNRERPSILDWAFSL
jgi:hypothetical protein